MAIQLIRQSVNVAIVGTYYLLYNVPVGKQLAVSRILIEPVGSTTVYLKINGVIVMIDINGIGTDMFGKSIFVAGDKIDITMSNAGYATMCGELLNI